MTCEASLTFSFNRFLPCSPQPGDGHHSDATAEEADYAKAGTLLFKRDGGGGGTSASRVQVGRAAASAPHPSNVPTAGIADVTAAVNTGAAGFYENDADDVEMADPYSTIDAGGGFGGGGWAPPDPTASGISDLETPAEDAEAASAYVSSATAGTGTRNTSARAASSGRGIHTTTASDVSASGRSDVRFYGPGVWQHGSLEQLSWEEWCRATYEERGAAAPNSHHHQQQHDNGDIPCPADVKGGSGRYTLPVDPDAADSSAAEALHSRHTQAERAKHQQQYYPRGGSSSVRRLHTGSSGFSAREPSSASASGAALGASADAHAGPFGYASAGGGNTCTSTDVSGRIGGDASGRDGRSGAGMAYGHTTSSSASGAGGSATAAAARTGGKSTSIGVADDDDWEGPAFTGHNAGSGIKYGSAAEVDSKREEEAFAQPGSTLPPPTSSTDASNSNSSDVDRRYTIPIDPTRGEGRGHRTLPGHGTGADVGGSVAATHHTADLDFASEPSGHTRTAAAAAAGDSAASTTGASGVYTSPADVVPEKSRRTLEGSTGGHWELQCRDTGYRGYEECKYVHVPAAKGTSIPSTAHPSEPLPAVDHDVDTELRQSRYYYAGPHDRHISEGLEGRSSIYDHTVGPWSPQPEFRLPQQLKERGPSGSAAQALSAPGRAVPGHVRGVEQLISAAREAQRLQASSNYDELYAARAQRAFGSGDIDSDEAGQNARDEESTLVALTGHYADEYSSRSRRLGDDISGGSWEGGADVSSNSGGEGGQGQYQSRSRRLPTAAASAAASAAAGTSGSMAGQEPSAYAQRAHMGALPGSRAGVSVQPTGVPTLRSDAPGPWSSQRPSGTRNLAAGSAGPLYHRGEGGELDRELSGGSSSRNGGGGSGSGQVYGSHGAAYRYPPGYSNLTASEPRAGTSEWATDAAGVCSRVDLPMPQGWPANGGPRAFSTSRASVAPSPACDVSTGTSAGGGFLTGGYDSSGSRPTGSAPNRSAGSTSGTAASAGYGAEGMKDMAIIGDCATVVPSAAAAGAGASGSKAGYTGRIGTGSASQCTGLLGSSVPHAHWAASQLYSGLQHQAASHLLPHNSNKGKQQSLLTKRSGTVASAFFEPAERWDEASPDAQAVASLEDYDYDADTSDAVTSGLRGNSTLEAYEAQSNGPPPDAVADVSAREMLLRAQAASSSAATKYRAQGATGAELNDEAAEEDVAAAASRSSEFAQALRAKYDDSEGGTMASSAADDAGAPWRRNPQSQPRAQPAIDSSAYEAAARSFAQSARQPWKDRNSSGSSFDEDPSYYGGGSSSGGSTAEVSSSSVEGGDGAGFIVMMPREASNHAHAAAIGATTTGASGLEDGAPSSTADAQADGSSSPYATDLRSQRFAYGYEDAVGVGQKEPKDHSADDDIFYGGLGSGSRYARIKQSGGAVGSGNGKEGSPVAYPPQQAVFNAGDSSEDSARLADTDRVKRAGGRGLLAQWFGW